MIIWLLYWVITLAGWAFSLSRGGRPARWSFLFFSISSCLSMASTWPEADNALLIWKNFNTILFFADATYFVNLTVLALVSHRHWPIYSAGFQLVCAMTHFGPLLDTDVSPKLYRGLETIWQLPMLVTMVVGIWLDRSADLSRAGYDGHTDTDPATGYS
ncbi:hypothetical protein [uncultured Novosphingobium sp.]|uniref:hypothetical protein n=1 Tax=uncultured Novosphingobium sp. TaxID=292277 RepID=UPI00374A3D59